MRCGHCGEVFELEEANKACSSCPMNRNCGKVSCPRCGYEMYKEIDFKLIKVIMDRVKKIWRAVGKWNSKI